MYILGVSAFYHDSASVLIKNGCIVYAIEEERFTRKKHDNRFPFRAINFCIKSEGISINDVDYIAYYEKPLLKFERILKMFVETYPLSFKPFLKSIPEWLTHKIKVDHYFRKALNYKGKIFFIPHHLSHAAASFYPSSFKDAAILTIDGVGEYQTTGLWIGNSNKIIPLKSISFPHSLGLLYSTFTSFLGFRVNDSEYKVMGLAAYGKPTYSENIYKILSIKDDGSFELNMKYFSFRESSQMWNKKFEKLFGKPRSWNQPITERDKNLASSIQEVIENIYFKILNHLHQITKCTNVCISGGVALNAAANRGIYQKSPFKNAYILGAAGDSGAAAGAALFTQHHILDNKTRHYLDHLYLGSSYDNREIESTLKRHNVNYKKFGDEDKLIEHAALLLSQNKVVGWFQNRMEFGPRALGSRSILANPKQIFMKEKVNKIKMREQFRPFAGSILQEKVHEYFDVPEKNHISPFMTFCFKAKTKGIEELAAIIHKDNTCRIQTVNQRNSLYYKLIKKFYEITGTPCILNTSFNLKDEPIVENPKQAIEDFLKTEMDYMIIGDFLISKSNYKE
ncbi:hypothetical protein IIA95_03085 [Patescibacteria group bacterium]|nr:hypothetical protein [Patescibacteria group bacterium]